MDIPKINSLYYNEPQPSNWTGRVDGTEREDLRWHQVVQCLDAYSQPDNQERSVSLLGFACDEGVRRNQGREGAADGPRYIRKDMTSLPVHFPSDLALYDRGDIVCQNGTLESAQSTLGKAVKAIIEQHSFPIVIGGGHEVTYGHFLGLQESLPGSIGIINIDAHFDLREPIDGMPTSGTGFYQIRQDLQHEGKPFHYLALGIQEISNTRRLFDRADEWGVEYVMAEGFYDKNSLHIQEKIKDFAAQVDHVYLTIDLDAFAAPYAWGVSALAFEGVVPDRTFYDCFDTMLALDNLVSVDIAEMSPYHDFDYRTSRFAASLIYRIVGSR